MFLSWVVGLVLILFGVGWGLLSFMAAGMADRETTWMEHAGYPLMGLIPIIVGIAVIYFR